MDENTANLIKDLIKDNPGVQINIGGTDISYNKFVIDGKKDDTFPIEDIFKKEAGGIGDRSQFWLLLVAASARGKIFANIPDFISKCFSTWNNIPFNQEECQKSTQDTLKGLPWTAINNQQKMIEFIESKCGQPAKRKTNVAIANRLFVALKENPWGEK